MANVGIAFARFVCTRRRGQWCKWETKIWKQADRDRDAQKTVRLRPSMITDLKMYSSIQT